MRNITMIFLAFLLCAYMQAQEALITGYVDSPCSSAVGRTVEIYVSGTVDFTSWNLQRQANGGGYTTNIDLSSFGTQTDEFIYVTNDEVTLDSEFGISSVNASIIENSTISDNGDDAFQIVDATNVVVDRFGEENIDGSGTVWEHTDTYYYRNDSATANAGVFDASNWTFGTIDLLDGEGLCNGGSALSTLVPFGSFQAGTVVNSSCNYTLAMADSFGDGWNGNTIDVLVNGTVVLDDVTLSGGDLGSLPFPVNPGDDVTTVWNGGGSYGSETSYEILDANGAAVGSGAESDISTGTITTFCPSCLIPSALGAGSITTNSADLSWAAEGSETLWNVEVVAAGSASTGTPTDVGVSNPFTVTGLTDATDYEFYVQAVCGGGDESIWAGPYSFTTACEAFSVPFCENFDGTDTGSSSNPTLPNCWNFIDSGSGYGFVSSTGANSFYMYNSSDSSGDYVLVSPEITDISSGENRVSFDVDGSTDQELIIGTMTDPNDAATFTTFDTITLATNNQESYTVNIPSGSNSYIAFRHGQTSTYVSYYLDNICFEEIPSCLEVSDLAVINETFDSVDISWTAGEDENEWEILYGEEGFDPETEGTSIIDNDGTLGETITGLEMDSEYEFYVRAVCSADNQSPWTGPLAFGTLYCQVEFTSDIEPITLVEIAGVSNTSDATVGASPSLEDFTDVVINLEQSGSYSINLEGNTNGTYYTTYFTVFFDWNQNGYLDDDGEVYEIGSITGSTGADDQQATGIIDVPQNAELGNTRMRVYKNFNSSITDPCDINSYGQAEDYTVNVMMSSCEDPSVITIDNITDSSADVAWTENGSATEWEIMYGEAGFDPATEGVVINDTDGAIGEGIYELISETGYDVYVRAICGENSRSAWVGPENFTTEPITCPVPSDIIIDSIETETAEVLWTENGTATEWEVLYGEEGFDPETEGTTITDDDSVPGIVLTDLVPITSYEVYVRAICEGGESEWAGAQSLTTTPLNDDFCAAIALTLDETCSGDAYTNIGATTQENEPEGDCFYGGAQKTVWFSFEAPANGAVSITTDIAPGDLSDSEIAVYAAPADCSDLSTLGAAIGCDQDGGGEVGNGYMSVLELTDLAVGETYFVQVSGYGYSGIEGDFCIEVQSVTLPCPTISDITVDNIEAETAEVYWTEGTATEWEVLYGITGFDPEIEGITVSDDDGVLGVVLTELVPSTSYDVYVRAICVDGESEWVGPVTFTTITVLCTDPSDITFNNITDTSAEVTWNENGSATEWEILYGEAGFDLETEGISVMDTYGELGETITSLTENTSYDVYVRAICDDGESEWTGPATFTTSELDLSQVKFGGFNYYPNPVNSNINLKANSEINEVTIFNLLGQEVLARQPNQLDTEIDMSHLANGAYLMNVEIDGASKTFKLIKE